MTRPRGRLEGVVSPHGAAGSDNPRYAADVLRSAEQNHMWLNAFACVRPADDLKRQIGEYVLRLLDEKDATILSSTYEWTAEKLGDDSALASQRCLVVRFNKS